MIDLLDYWHIYVAAVAAVLSLALVFRDRQSYVAAGGEHLSATNAAAREAQPSLSIPIPAIHSLDITPHKGGGVVAPASSASVDQSQSLTGSLSDSSPAISTQPAFFAVYGSAQARLPTTDPGPGSQIKGALVVTDTIKAALDGTNKTMLINNTTMGGNPTPELKQVQVSIGETTVTAIEGGELDLAAIRLAMSSDKPFDATEDKANGDGYVMKPDMKPDAVTMPDATADAATGEAAAAARSLKRLSTPGTKVMLDGDKATVTQILADGQVELTYEDGNVNRIGPVDAQRLTVVATKTTDDGTSRGGSTIKGTTLFGREGAKDITAGPKGALLQSHDIDKTKAAAAVAEVDGSVVHVHPEVIRATSALTGISIDGGASAADRTAAKEVLAKCGFLWHHQARMTAESVAIQYHEYLHSKMGKAKFSKDPYFGMREFMETFVNPLADEKQVQAYSRSVDLDPKFMLDATLVPACARQWDALLQSAAVDASAAAQFYSKGSSASARALGTVGSGAGAVMNGLSGRAPNAKA